MKTKLNSVIKKCMCYECIFVHTVSNLYSWLVSMLSWQMDVFVKFQYSLDVHSPEVLPSCQTFLLACFKEYSFVHFMIGYQWPVCHRGIVSLILMSFSLDQKHYLSLPSHVIIVANASRFLVHFNFVSVPLVVLIIVARGT